MLCPQEIQLAVGLGWLLWLPLAAGCGHESAASPVIDAARATATPKPVEKHSSADNHLSATSETEVAPTSSSHETNENQAAAAAPVPPTMPPGGQRPPADRTPTRPGEAEKITFEDLNLGMPADVAFREFMVTDRVKELEGKRISIVGYMHGGQSTQRGIKDFILLKNTQCKFGPGGQADHLTNVILREGATTGFTPSPVKVEGTLKLEPFQGPDGNTWSIYRLDDAQIR